jgi:hypothetical protein
MKGQGQKCDVLAQITINKIVIWKHYDITKNIIGANQTVDRG